MMVLSGHLAEVPMENHKKCSTIGVLAWQFPNVSHSQLWCGYIHTSDYITWITTNHHRNVYSPCPHGFGLLMPVLASKTSISISFVYIHIFVLQVICHIRVISY